MDRSWLFGLALLVLPGTASSGRAADGSLFQWQKRLTARVDSSVQVPTAVVLDSEVYDSSRPDLTDLRLVDQDGVEQAYVLETAHTLRPGTAHTAQLAAPRDFREEAGNLLVFRFELTGTNPVADRISLTTTLRDFQRSVTVDGSPDGKNWTRLVENAPIFDSSRHPDFSCAAVRLPRGNGCRQFEIRISAPDDRLAAAFADFTRVDPPAGADQTGLDRATSRIRPLFRVDRIEFWQETATAAAPAVQTAVVPPESWRTTRDAILHATVVEFGTRGEPLSAVTLLTPARNFIRLARLDTWTGTGRNSGAWTEAARGTLSSLQTASADDGCQTLRLPGPVTSRRWRLVIEDLDNPPLPVTGLALESPARHLIFLADAGHQYRLLFGAPGVDAPPQYDLAAGLARLRQSPEFSLRIADAESRQPNPDFGQNRAVTAPPSTFNRKLALTAGVALALLILSWGLFKAAAGSRNDPISRG